MATETTRQQPSGVSTFIWALFFFFAFTILVILGIRWAGERENYEDTRAGMRLEKRAERDKADAEQLDSVGWVDEAKGLVRVPIADAKRLVLADLQGKKPAPSTILLDPRLPKPVIDPAATEPPPPALTSAPQGADTIYFPDLDKPAAAPPAPAPAPEPAKPDAKPAAPTEPGKAAPAEPQPAAPEPAPAKPASEPAPAPAPVPAAPAPAPEKPAPAPPEPKPASAPAAPPAPEPAKPAPPIDPALAPLVPQAGPERPPLINDANDAENPQPESN